MEFYILDHEATFEDLKKFNYPNQKIGVIAHIENKKGEILLQQRGEKSRDENGLYEDIGGKVDSEDRDFKSAIIREIKEEAGENISLMISDSIGIYHVFKSDIHWIFIVYFATYIDGEIQIMEPDKCLGYKFFKQNEAIQSFLVTDSCKFLIKIICQKDNRFRRRNIIWNIKRI